ncbi:hypothetical protein CPT_Merlin264 [Citrobacter phage Merlin]|uniref:DUF7247 domain-containing protein n=1 Tax=Citrobacter phage Merlin TaxID=1675602 RepID=A0A0K1LP28_9CAUD|nr:hypothetical protein CPT_Merlin264 [Citrobacter phage Merlin]AKU43910.1 hypothetical protein CPT_Merlin264 [Citrobacter phage Merlin]
MADIWCSAAPVVNIRCQFDHIPGVTHISMQYEDGRGQKVFCKINFSGGFGPEVALSENDLNAVLTNDTKFGTLGLFNENVSVELCEAINKGFVMLRKMVMAAKKVTS